MDDFNNQNNYDPNNYQQPMQYSQYQEQPEPGKNFAIASLVLSIVSFVLCCCGGPIFSILGIIFGVMSRQRQPENNGMATAGIVLSIVSLVLCVVGTIIGVATGLFEANYYSNFY